MPLACVLLRVEHGALEAEELVALEASSLYLAIAARRIAPPTVFHLPITQIKCNISSENIIVFLIGIHYLAQAHRSSQRVFRDTDTVLNVVDLHRWVSLCHGTHHKHY